MEPMEVIHSVGFNHLHVFQSHTVVIEHTEYLQLDC